MFGTFPKAFFQGRLSNLQFPKGYSYAYRGAAVGCKGTESCASDGRGGRPLRLEKTGGRALRLQQTWKVIAWEIATWENTLGKLPFGKIPLWTYLTWYIVVGRIYTPRRYCWRQFLHNLWRRCQGYTGILSIHSYSTNVFFNLI